MSMRLSEHAIFSDLDNLTGSDGEPGRQDIGGTNAQTDYVTMKGFARACFYSVLGSWNGTDDVDECRIQQATSAAGGSVKEQSIRAGTQVQNSPGKNAGADIYRGRQITYATGGPGEAMGMGPKRHGGAPVR